MRRFFSPTAVKFYTSLPLLVKPAGSPLQLPALDFEGVAHGCPPVFTARQIELHYTKHHKAYVDKFNALVPPTNTSFDGKTVEDIAASLQGVDGQQVLFNQVAQHYNHSFFWKCLTPNGSPMSDELTAALVDGWKSVDAFKKAFQEQCVGNFGSGWTWLVYDVQAKKLKIVNTGNAFTPVAAKDSQLRPLLTVDVWEHAYYKDFENRRADYVAEIWKVVNWKFVAGEYAKALKP